MAPLSEGGGTEKTLRHLRPGCLPCGAGPGIVYKSKVYTQLCKFLSNKFWECARLINFCFFLPPSMRYVGQNLTKIVKNV